MAKITPMTMPIAIDRTVSTSVTRAPAMICGAKRYFGISFQEKLAVAKI